MDRHETIERVAAGLRAMHGNGPEVLGFLYLDESPDETWDESEILGLPVFHSGFVNPPGCYESYSCGGLKCCWLPLFGVESRLLSVQVTNFVRAFTEWDG